MSNNKKFDQRTATNGTSTKDVAADEAKNVAKNAQESGKQVAGTAKGEAQQLAGEAKGHAQSLLHQVRGEAASQVTSQQQRLAGSLRTVSGDLDQMARSTDSTTASGLVSQAAGQVEQVAAWLENREPAELLTEARRYASRNPGTFLAGAALLGLIGGRLTRGLQADAQRTQGDHRNQGTGSGYVGRTQGSGYRAAYGDQGYVGQGYTGQAGYVEQTYAPQGGQVRSGQGYTETTQTTVYDQEAAPATYGTETRTIHPTETTYPTAEGRGFEQRGEGDFRR